MKYLLIFMILLSVLGNASPRAPTLEEILDCSYSVFYGEVVEGKVKSKSYKFENNEFVDKYGSYKIRVIENIAGKKQGHITKVFPEYSATMVGVCRIFIQLLAWNTFSSLGKKKKKFDFRHIIYRKHFFSRKAVCFFWSARIFRRCNVLLYG